jgi:basic membrane protein A
MNKEIVLGLAAAAFLSAGPLGAGAAAAQEVEIMPAIVYGTGGQFDKSFNESAYTGAERFLAETGIEYRYFEPTDDTQGEQALRNFASRGFSPVIAVSFAWTEALTVVAAEFPDTQFVIVDSVVEAPNVRSVVFKEEEGSYLVGVLAAMQSESGTLGFIGGMDIPLIHKFSCGYAQGIMATNPDATFIENYVGTTGAAWNDPIRAGELTQTQMDQGADVIFAAAGASGLGALQAAADAGNYGIGVDSNQNYLHPGNVLTSMVKRVDVAVYQAFADARAGAFTADIQSLGLAEDGVGWADDEFNADLITAEMRTAVDAAREGIVSGSITVHDYMTDDSCPAGG